jgi:hypothetical protein
MVRYTLKNKQLPTRYTYKNDIRIKTYLEGGGVIDWVRHKIMMYEFDKVMNSMRKANNKLKKYEAPLKDFNKRYEYYDKEIVNFLNEYFSGLRLLQLFEFQLKDIKNDPSKKLHEANVNANIVKIKLKLAKLERDYKLQTVNDVNDMKSLLKWGKKIEPKLQKYQEKRSKLDAFTKKYEKTLEEGRRFDITSEVEASTKESKKLSKKVKAYKKDYEKLNKLSSAYYDELDKTQSDIINLRENITNLQNNIASVDKKKKVHEDLIKDWKAKGDEFYTVLVKFEKNDMLSSVNEIKERLSSIRKLYISSANPTIESRIVPKFRKLDEDAESVLQILTTVKGEMSRIKKNFLERAPAAELNVDITYLTKGVNKSVEMLHNIDNFIEQYQTQGGWKHFFESSSISGGAAKPKTPEENVIEAIYKRNDGIKAKLNDGKNLEMSQKYDRALKTHLKFDMNVFNDSYIYELTNGSWMLNINVGYYKRQNNNAFQLHDFQDNQIPNTSINFNNINGFDKNRAMLYPLNVPNYYIFYPGTRYTVDRGTSSYEIIDDKYLDHLFIVYAYEYNKKYKLLFLDPYTGLPVITYEDNDCPQNEKVISGLLMPWFDNSQHPYQILGNNAVILSHFLSKSKPKSSDKCNMAKGLANFLPDFDVSKNHSKYTSIHKNLYKLYFSNDNADDEYIQSYNRDIQNNTGFRNTFITHMFHHNFLANNINSYKPNLGGNLIFSAQSTVSISAMTGSPTVSPAVAQMAQKQADSTLDRLKKILGPNFANVQNNQEIIRNKITDFINKYDIGKQGSNTARSTINKVMAYVNDLQAIEGKFIVYKPGESIESSITGWDLKETMRADKIDTDNSAVKELKDKLDTTYASKIEQDLISYRTANKPLYLDMILKAKDPYLLVRMDKNLLDYLNTPGVVKNMIDTPTTIFDKDTGKTKTVPNEVILEKMAFIIGENPGLITFGNDASLVSSLMSAYQAYKSRKQNQSKKKKDKSRDRDGDRDGDGDGDGDGSSS